MATVMVDLSVISLKILAVEMFITLSVTWVKNSRSNVNMPIERSNAFYVLELIAFVPPGIVCELFVYELLNVLDSNL